MNKKFDYYFWGIYTIVCIIAMVYYTQEGLPEIAVLWLGCTMFNMLNSYRLCQITKIQDEKHNEFSRKAHNGETIDWDVFYCKYL